MNYYGVKINWNKEYGALFYYTYAYIYICIYIYAYIYIYACIYTYYIKNEWKHDK